MHFILPYDYQQTTAQVHQSPLVAYMIGVALISAALHPRGGLNVLLGTQSSLQVLRYHFAT